MWVLLKQIWRFVWIAATGPGASISLMLLVAIIACQLANIQVTLRQVQWSADFYNALQKLDAPTAIAQVCVFALLVGCSSGLYLVSRYVKRVLQFRWRRRLSDMLLDKWMTHKTYWFLHPSLGSQSGIDNPDQRIAEDCNMFAEFILGTKDEMRLGVLDFIMSLVGLVSYATLLWQLATFALQISVFGFDIEIPRYMVWAAPVYVVIATVLTHLLGHRLSGLLMEEQRREADFRFALVHVRENASAIALSDGEAAERRTLAARFHDVVDIWHRVIRREFIYGLFTRPYFASVLRIPTFLALPAFLAGKVSLGGLMQLAQAFSNVVTTTSWLIFNYKFISDLVATTRRLQGFADGMDDIGQASSGVTRTVSPHEALQLRNVSIHAPDRRVLLRISNLTVSKGETVWLSGNSGLGKSTLVKALAGLWRFGEGEIVLPAGRLHFMPQQVYMPLDSLAAAAAYPLPPEDVSTAAIEDLLHKAGLGHRLTTQDNAGGLSVGEQQRLALVRLVLAKPDWAFLDEATSALDLATEQSMMTMVRSMLPDTTFVVIAHREPQGLGAVRNIALGHEGLTDQSMNDDAGRSGELVTA